MWIIYLIFILFSVLLTTLGGHLIYKGDQRWEDEVLEVIGVPIMVVGVVAFLFFSVALVIELNNLLESSDKTDYFNDIKAQCESVDGVFNKSAKSPACYLDGERIPKEEE